MVIEEEVDDDSFEWRIPAFGHLVVRGFCRISLVALLALLGLIDFPFLLAA